MVSPWCAVLLMVLIAGCDPEPGKIYGQSSHGSSTASAEAPRARFVVDGGDASATLRVLERVRARLAAMHLDTTSAIIVGTGVQLDVPRDRRAELLESMRERRLDVMHDKTVLIRGENVDRVTAAPDSLTLVVDGPRKSALKRALDERHTLTVVVDGEPWATFEATSSEVRVDAGLVVIRMDSSRSQALAARLSGQSFGHQTMLTEGAP